MSLSWPYAYGTLGFTGTRRSAENTTVESSLGGGVGLTQRLWIDGSAGSFKMAPKPSYHSPQVGLNVLILDTPAFELDATTHVTFLAEDGRTVEQVEPGFFTVVRIARKLRLDNGLYVDVNPSPDTTTVGLRAPLNIGFQITNRVNAVINTGVTINDLADTAGSTVVPMGLTLGWSTRIGSKEDAPSFGLVPSFSFPELVKLGTQENIWNPGYATVGITFVYVSKL